MFVETPVCAWKALKVPTRRNALTMISMLHLSPKISMQWASGALSSVPRREMLSVERLKAVSFAGIFSMPF